MSRSPQEEIYLQIRGQFKAAEKCADKVKELIAEYYPTHFKLNRTTLLLIMKMIRKDFKREEWPDVKYMFKSIFVYILADHKPHLFMKDVAELIAVYPEFSDADEVEKSLLLQFRNYFIVACEIIEPKNHKGELIALVGRMCGAIYVTGGGQTTATDRRVLLYERETGIAPRKQPERKRRADDPATLSLQALHSRNNQAFEAIQARPLSTAEMDPVFNKRPRYEAPDTQTLLRSADSFWSYHRALMESGEDIPYKTVPADQAYSSYAYPSHDLPYAMSHPLAMTNHPSMHPSMRFLHDPLRRPQMPMSMQMQLPPGRPLATPLPLPLNTAINGVKAGGSTSAGPGAGAGPVRTGGIAPANGTASGAANGTANGATNGGASGPAGGLAGGSNAGNATRAMPPSQMPNSTSGDPHKFQALQQAMSMPPPQQSLYDYSHPSPYGPPPMRYGGYYGGPPPAPYQYPYSYQQPMPLLAPTGSDEHFVPRAHPQGQYPPPPSQPSQYGVSQYASNGPYGYSGPGPAGYSGHMGPPSQPQSTQGRAQPLPQSQSKPPAQQYTQQSYSQSNTQQPYSQVNTQPNSHSQPLLRGPGSQSGAPSASGMPAPAPQQQQQQQRAPHAPYAPLAYVPPAQYYEPQQYASAVQTISAKLPSAPEKA